MSNIGKTRSNRGLSARAVAGATFIALLAFGSFASPAAARWGDQNERRDEWRNERNERNENRQDWNRGYYQTPPVVYERYYSAPTYYAPPVVYGPSYDPGFGLNIIIR